MKIDRIRNIVPFLILITLLPTSLLAGSKEPIRGSRFERLIAAQQTDLQKHLERLLPEAEGYFVTGPIDLPVGNGSGRDQLYSSIRVICPSLPAIDTAVNRLRTDDSLNIVGDVEQLENGGRGTSMEIIWSGQSVSLLLNTPSQTRWLIWAKSLEAAAEFSPADKTLVKYMEAVSDYLMKIEIGNPGAPEPRATEFGLPEEFDLYAPPPPYVIEGYQNYLTYLHSYAEIKTDFARGVTAFVAGDSLLDAMIANAPAEAFPNKEAAMLQREYRKFFQREGRTTSIQTLTASGFDTLASGEYFFAVGLDGSIRFGREMTRLEVSRLEEETGKRVPRANHAFLFPGEPILTAGAFFIEENDKPRLVKVNAQSGHYFYSNVTETIREDIAIRSDHYLMTLGHLFKALDDLGIEYNSVLISKL